MNQEICKGEILTNKIRPDYDSYKQSTNCVFEWQKVCHANNKAPEILEKRRRVKQHQQSQQQIQSLQLTQQQQKFTGYRYNGKGWGLNNRFSQQSSIFAKLGYHMDTVPISEELLAVEVQDFSAKHTKIQQIELLQQPKASPKATAVRREELNKGASRS
ncbi:MAG: hypothetical protein EZS28_038727 [Streblomastix strix]|uniref:Uncharacterized protein n=1 Tax=Streblomastix strix TaxID=222440 RepID=A0A5J4U7M6_9EUKA|nr:MAG: hypothetical protein EZS28_038727 [Streblomastix strix]